MTLPLPRVHAVTSDGVLQLPDRATRARALANAGAVALHARSHTIGGRRLIECATMFNETGAVVFVNDRADVARVVHAAGLHLPARGLPVAAARQIVGPHMLIGRSAHSASEARRAADEGADYVFLGPIWETASHPHRAPLGPHVIAEAHPARVIAIGGITPERARICREQGAHGVAAISALWQAADPGAAVRAILLSLDG